MTKVPTLPAPPLQLPEVWRSSLAQGHTGSLCQHRGEFVPRPPGGWPQVEGLGVRLQSRAACIHDATDSPVWFMD